MALYPVSLDICNQLCLIIGGGVVAKRKVEALLPCGPQIIVISPELCPGLVVFAEKKQIEWKQRKYHAGDLAGAKLVFAATDSRLVQQEIVKEADAAGILVNVINDPDCCSFQVPAMFRQGKLLITVATGAASPALAARIRKELEVQYGEEYGLLLSLMAAVRKQIVALNNDQGCHKQLFEKILDSDILPLIKAADWSQLRVTLRAVLPVGIEVERLIIILQTEENASMETLSC
jgi:precorrin-2 dehydrogenase